MKSAYACFVGMALMGTLALAQNTATNLTDQQGGVRRLEITQRVSLKGTKGAIVLPPQCDQEGNVYTRFYHPGMELKEPVYKFTEQGQQEAEYSLASDVGKGAGVESFATGKDGNVYLLVSSKTGYYIITYAKNGVVEAKVRLAVKFQPFHFGVFDSGEFLVTGGDTAYGPQTFNIVTGLFNRSGALRKVIELPEDKPFVEAARRGDVRFAQSRDGGNLAVQRGQVTRGSDGNMYVVRWTDPARIYAIAPSGEVVHSFEVRPDWEGRRPDGAYSYDGRLALEYAGTKDEPGHSMVKVVRLNGEDQASYDTSGRGGTLTCYTKMGFTFFRGDELLFAQLP